VTLYDVENQILSMNSISEVLKDVAEPKFEMLGFGSLLGYYSLSCRCVFPFFTWFFVLMF
jgi:hypothetical protein